MKTLTMTVIDDKKPLDDNHKEEKDIDEANIMVKREPVESSDTDETSPNTTESGNIDLPEMMRNCQISSDNVVHTNGEETNDSEENISVNFSTMTLKEGSTEVLRDKLQSLTDCKCPDGEAVDSKSALESRGPHRGQATGYVPNLPNYQPIVYGDQYYVNRSCCQTGRGLYMADVNGKRKPEEDEDNPYKYRSTVTDCLNNLNVCDSPKLLNKKHTSGGTLTVNYECNNAGLDESNIDEILNMLDNGITNVDTRTCTMIEVRSEGYVSENSPFTEEPCSPMGLDSPPPSNLSHLSDDSGISSQGVKSPESRISEVTSPDHIGMNIGCSGINPSYPELEDQLSFPMAPLFDVVSPLPASQIQCPDFLDEKKGELADVLKIIAQDLDEDRKKKEDRAKQQNTSCNINSNVNNFPKRVNYHPNTFSGMKEQQLTCQTVSSGQQSPQYVKIHPVASVNTQHYVNTKPLINTQHSINTQQKPIVISRPRNLTNIPVNPVTTQAIPVTTILISPNQPVFVVSTPMRPTKRNPTTYVPIQPKLPPVPKQNIPSTHPPITGPNYGIPTTVHDDNPSEKNSRKVPEKPLIGNMNNEDSKKLNLARRLVAKMTSDDLRYQDNEGDTYLVVAACKAVKNMVQALLERLEREKLTGMIDVHNHSRQTALYCAVSANNPDMVEMLIRYGADVNTLAERMLHSSNSKEVTAAIHVASSNGQEYIETLEALLKSKELNLNNANSDGQTALHCAILSHNKSKQDSNGCIDSTGIIETLINSGADINTQDKKSGKTPLMYALETKNYQLIQSVVKNIKPDKIRTYLRTQSFDGNTAQKILDSLKSTLDNKLWLKVHDMMMCLDKDTHNNSHNIKLFNY